MIQPAHRVLLLLMCLAALCGSGYAQTEKTITIRMLDSKTGLLIATSNFLVRVNHEETVHGDWVKQNEDGTGKLTLPGDADVVSLRATYESAMYTYSNCDADKDRPSSEQAPSPDPVSYTHLDQRLATERSERRADRHTQCADRHQNLRRAQPERPCDCLLYTSRCV